MLSIVLQSNNDRNIILLPDYFYAQLSQIHQGYNFANVTDFITRKFVENPALLDSDIIFPIHIPGHWIFAIIVGPERILYLIDSMGKLYGRIAENIIRWYHDMSFFLDKRFPFTTNDWSIVASMVNSPSQTDSHSCGVFAIMTAIYWIRERRLPTMSDWTQNNIPAYYVYT